jgi:hypothetical protein
MIIERLFTTLPVLSHVEIAKGVEIQGHAARGRLAMKDQMLLDIQQGHEARVLKERAKGDRLEENMKDARVLEDRTEADDAIYDLVDQHVMSGSPASGKVGRS